MKRNLLLASVLLIATTGFSQMRVGSNAAATEMLHVEGAILIGTSTIGAPEAGTIRWNPAATPDPNKFEGFDGTNWIPLQGDNLGDHTATENLVLDDNWLSNDGDNEGITIDNNGQVGVGTDSPGYFLHVFEQTNGGELTLGKFEVLPSSGVGTTAGVSIEGQRGNPTNDYAFIDLENNSTGNHIRLAANSANGGLLRVYSNATELLSLASSGALTINNAFTLPTADGSNGQLLRTDGSGNVSWSDATGIITAENGLTETAPATIRLGGALTQATTISGLTASNKLSFSGTGVDAFNVDGTTLSVDATNDRVGVGTSSPAAKLDVSGGNIALNDNQIRLRAGNDGNHYIAHLGGSFDGPILHGNQTVYLSTGQNAEGVRVLGSAAGGTQLVVDASYDLGTMPPSESTLILGSRGGVEGAQIQMNNANSAGTAWFIDVETNDLRFMTGNNATGSSALAVKLESNGRLEAEEFNTRSGRFRSAQRADFYLSLQNDRNMVLYDGGAIWSSGTAVSDIRTKKNIRPLENVLPTLIDLSTIRFQYKEELELGDEDHIGVIAQEILEYFPDMVYHDKVSDRYIVHYDKLTTVLLRGLQEQQHMIESLTNSNFLLSSGYEGLKAELDEVKSFIYQRSDNK